MRHGFPPAMQYGGTSFVTTEFAPMIAPSPMCTPGITVTFWPIQTSLPTTVSPFSGRSSSGGANEKHYERIDMILFGLTGILFT